MKNILLLICLLCNSIIVSAQFSGTTDETDYCNFIFMNHEIKHTLEEHKRQTTITNNETVNTVLENKNKNDWTNVKSKIKRIQDRLKIIDPALQVIPSLVVVSREYKDILDNQKKIFQESQDLPPNIQEVLKREIEFSEDLILTTGFFMGLTMSYGPLMQMERSERKILIEHGLQEVNKLKNHSYYTLFLIREAKRAIELRKQTIKYIENRDKELVKNTINEFKELFE